MKCPKCGFNSFEFHDNCSKCGKDLTAFKATYNIKPLVQPHMQGAPEDFPLEPIARARATAAPAQSATTVPLPLQEAAAAFGADDFAFHSTPTEPAPAALETVAASAAFESVPTEALFDSEAPQAAFQTEPDLTGFKEDPAPAAFDTDPAPATFDLPAEPDPTEASSPKEAPVLQVARPAEPQPAAVSAPAGSSLREEGVRELSLDDFVHFADLNAGKGKTDSAHSFGKGGFDLDDLFPPDPAKAAEGATVQQAPTEKDPEKKEESAQGLDWLE